jgi:hypothetical protein
MISTFLAIGYFNSYFPWKVFIVLHEQRTQKGKTIRFFLPSYFPFFLPSFLPSFFSFLPSMESYYVAYACLEFAMTISPNEVWLVSLNHQKFGE